MLPTDPDKITAPELDELIAALVQHRALLEPAVAPAPPEKLPTILGPAWTLHGGPIGSLLQIRHPGHGWLAFVIPPGDRAHMVGYMLSQAVAVMAMPPAPMKVPGKKMKAKRK